MSTNVDYLRLANHVKPGAQSVQPRVCLSMPGYGELTSGAARGFWRATRLPDDKVYYQYNEGSLLAANFNTLWTRALNLALNDATCPTYFAMQHADIEPEDYWLDALIAELEAHNLDVLGVVAPIKDPKGLTSIALDRPDGDTWRPLCRLTMTEVHRLPATFTSADVGHPLLLNTGLWVCRFDPAWARQVRFTINDRIVFDQHSGRYLAQCEPEDWYFSRLCHELDLKVGVTRKVKLIHRGPTRFPNDRVWGTEDHDRAWIDHSPLDDLPAGRFVLPGGVPGWLTHAEGKQLAELARGKRVLEVGSYAGLSTICLARTAQWVMAIDPHDGRGTAHPAHTLPMLLTNLERFDVAGKVNVRVGTLHDATGLDLAMMYPNEFDLVFIDGDHDRESVTADLEAALPLLAPDGVLAFHDYGPANGNLDPGVTAAVDAFLGRGAELLSLTDSLAVVKAPASIPALPLEV